MGTGTRYPFVEKYLQETLKQGSRVLETGCGGALYRENIVSLGASYTGCDLPNLLYQTGHDVDVFCSGNRLPFSENSFDLVFNQGAFDYIPEPSRTISEAFRVLRPGGIFTIFTYRKDVLETIDRNCKLRGREWELGHHVYSSRELLGWLTERGFLAREITRALDTIQSRGKKRKIMDFFRVYQLLQARVSIWRVFEAVKPS